MPTLTVLACLLVGLLGCGVSQGASVPRGSDVNQLRSELLYPHDSQFLVRTINRTAAFHHAPLMFRLPFFGFDFRYVFVHRDGHLLFNKGLRSHDPPYSFPLKDVNMEDDPSLIAPWLSHQDVPEDVPGAGVYFQVVNVGYEKENNELLWQRLQQDFKAAMVGSKDFVPTHALIVTWKNMTFANRMPGRPLVTNTYQAVVATDERRTYVMFNYGTINWVTSQDTYEGQMGVRAFVGFNAGNQTRAYEFKPYSQSPRVRHLPNLGFGNGLKGRFFFQIGEEVSPGSCIDNYLDVNWSERPKLTFFPRYGSIGGGTVVNVTGPCFMNPSSKIRCLFGYRVVDGVYINTNQASCVSPFTMRRGFVDVSVSVDNGPYLFSDKFYVRPQGTVDEDPHLVSSDRVNYTINKDSQFVIGGVNSSMFDIRGVLAPQMSRNQTVVDKRLVAVRARFNTSSVVEFRTRPRAARWQYWMYVLVDDEYVYFKDFDSQVLVFKGVTLYQPVRMYNMSHVVAKFDSGATVEVMIADVMAKDSSLNAQIYLPHDLRKLKKTGK